MKAKLIGLVAWAACAASACGTAAPRPIGAKPVQAAAGPLPAGPSAPDRGLPIPDLRTQWSPPIVSGGDIDAFASALAAYPSVAVHAGSRLAGAGWERRARELVAALSPATEVVKVEDSAQTEFVAGGVPLQRAEGGDRPRYVAQGVKLAPKWNAGGAAAGAAAAVLTIDDAAIDEAAWRALPASAVGSCDAPLSALALGQEQSLAQLEPFLDHGDAVLWQVYGAELRTYLPRISEELGEYAELKTRRQFDNNKSWEQYQCGHAYWEYLQNFTACGNEAQSCPSAPRLFLVGGLRIGTPEPSFFIDDKCPSRVGRDYVADLRTLAREAAQVAREHLDRRWVVLADRAGAITELHAALEDICTPRRRRFAEADLAQARARLGRIGDLLGSDDLDNPRGDWHIEDSAFHVPSLGPVQQVARFDAGRTSAANKAVGQSRALRQFVLSRGMCRAGYQALPLAAMLIDTAAGKATHVGFFYTEELFCADLPPLRTGAPPAPATTTTEASPSDVPHGPVAAGP